MIDPAAFTIEEYKIAQEKMKNSRDILNRLETVTVGGAVVVLGVMLGIGVEKKMPPLFAWWAILLIFIAAGVRCSAYYLYVWRLQDYIMKIEHSVPRGELKGFETFNRGKAIGPILGLCVNMFMWAIIIGVTLCLAVMKSIGLNIP